MRFGLFASGINGEQLHNLAAEKHCTPNRLAVAWPLAPSEYIIPMVEVNLTITSDDLAAVDDAFALGAIWGPATQPSSSASRQVDAHHNQARTL